MSGWAPIETAERNETKTIELGYWSGERWIWLTHGAWSDKDQSWMTDEKINPTHWRAIGSP